MFSFSLVSCRMPKKKGRGGGGKAKGDPDDGVDMLDVKESLDDIAGGCTNYW